MVFKRLHNDDEDSPSSDFESLLQESLSKPERKVSVGDKIKAEVLSVGKDRVVVSTGTRFDGMVPANLLQDEKGLATVKTGDSVELYVTYVKGSEVLMSPNPTTQNLADGIQEAFASGMSVEGRVEAVNKGGFEVTIFGKSAFCPISQMDIKRIDTPEDYVGKKFEFKISQLTGRNFVVSRRKVLEEGQGVALATFADQRKVGDVVTGTVTRLEPFGAFVEISPGLEGLVHVSELSWARVNDPKEVVSPGQVVTAKIVRLEQGERRLKISLSLKQDSGDPWNNLPAQIQSGRVVTGKVTRCMPFGAFVELHPGLEGLIPLSEMSSTKRVARADEVVKEGEEVAVLIKELNPGSKRISLSIKDAQSAAASASESEDIKHYAATQAARGTGGSGGSLGTLAEKMQAALAKKQKSEK